MSENQAPSFFESYMKGKQRGTQMSQEVAWIARSARAIFLLFSTLIVTPMELLLRHRFGERYLGLFTVIAAGLIAGLATGFLAELVQGDAPPELAQVWGLFNLAFMMLAWVVGIAHLSMIAIRTRKGVRWHSRSDGLPLPVWRMIGLKEAAVRLYGEPAVCLLLAAISLIPAMPLAFYLAAIGVLLWMNEMIRRREQRGQLLAVIDSQIEAEEQQNAMRGAPSIETKGFAVRGMQPRTAAERRTLEQMIAGLDKPVRAMVTSGDQSDVT